MKKEKEEVQPEEAPAEETPAVPAEPLDRVWIACGGLITALAAFLRFYWLDLKPLHHDEGVNGFFLTNLVRDGVYKYDPANYHGPTLYYLTLPWVKLFGMDTFAVRASVGIWGVLTVVLVLYLRRYLGTIGTLFAALFVALSPGMVFISRYFIHEIFFVFLSLAIVMAILFFIESKPAGPGAIAWLSLILMTCLLPSAFNLAAFVGGENAAAVWLLRLALLILDAVVVYYIVQMLTKWENGRAIYVLLASSAVSLYFATKETAFITLGTMAIACFVVWVWYGIREGEPFRKNALKIVIAFHGLLVAGALIYRDTLMDGWKWFTGAFVNNPFRPPENFVFYTLIFLVVASLAGWAFYLLDMKNGQSGETEEPVDITVRGFWNNLGENKEKAVILGAAAVLFCYVGVLFFSSFFTYAQGVGKAFEAYAIWTKTGNKDHTQNGAFAYLKWGMKVEGPILIISALGILISLARGKQKFAMFTAMWGFGLFLAYTIIPYKTPWLALSFLLPLCMIAGYAIGEMFLSKNMITKVLAGVIALSGSTVLAYQTYQHSFVRYDDDDMPYVYAHTKRGFHDLIRDIDRYAEKSGKGKDAVIDIVSPDYWPMTWYLKDFTHANFFGNLIDSSNSEMIVTKKNDQDIQVMQRWGGKYKWVNVYPLRPGVNLVLLVRKDIAEPDAQELSTLPQYKTVPGYTQ